MRWRKWVVAPAVLAVAGLSFMTGPAAAKANPVPPNSKAYGHSLSDWMTRYFEEAFGRPTDSGKRLIALPLPAGTCDNHAFTSTDPGTCVGHLDVNLKTGTPFMLPIAAWYGESYINGTPSDDAPLDKSVFTGSDVLIQLDGSTLINSNVDDLSRWYFGPNYFDPPIVYSQPTAYGSISANFVQGLGMTNHPLSKGVHHMSLKSEVIAFVPNYSGRGVPLDVGVKFENTWTITVTK
jgi:hypothetical protein